MEKWRETAPCGTFALRTFSCAHAHMYKQKCLAVEKWRESALRGTGDTLRALSDMLIHTYTHTQRFGLGKWRETALHGTIQKFPFSKVGI